MCIIPPVGLLYKTLYGLFQPLLVLLMQLHALIVVVYVIAVYVYLLLSVLIRMLVMSVFLINLQIVVALILYRVPPAFVKLAIVITPWVVFTRM